MQYSTNVFESTGFMIEGFFFSSWFEFFFKQILNGSDLFGI